MVITHLGKKLEVSKKTQYLKGEIPIFWEFLRSGRFFPYNVLKEQVQLLRAELASLNARILTPAFLVINLGLILVSPSQNLTIKWLVYLGLDTSSLGQNINKS